MTIEEMIAAVQAELRIQVDGKAGPETWGAVYRHIVKPAARPVVAPGATVTDLADVGISNSSWWCTSRWWTWSMAGAPVWKPWCVGNTRNAAWCRRSNSSDLPKKPG